MRIVLSIVLLILASCLNSCSYGGADSGNLPLSVTLSKDTLIDKIKGGWAGQTIGCTYGGPTEFRYRSAMIPDSVDIYWSDTRIKDFFDGYPALYDDVFMDITFVNVFDRLGLDAPADSFALAFANAPYPLWHANQAARFNILQGVMPPASGHWLNNPHADDIDYQIEADFAGLMSPGMPNTASEISDKIGHIMNYGDGWYGGVYVGAMYSLAFVTDSVRLIVEEALKTIPAESRFYKCISDVIEWHDKYPDDWRLCWEECEKKWNNDRGCPEGTLMPYNIDAVINSAYIVIGLLYGEGDFGKTMDVATRCGQDSDCNPASAAGILGAMIGYSNIPERWLKGLKMVEDRNFAYTDVSLNKVYLMSFDQALQEIERNGGKVSDHDVTIKCQKPEAVKLEQGFEGLYPKERRELNALIGDMSSIDFEGNGAVITGGVKCDDQDYVAEIEFLLDGVAVKTMKLPAHKRHKTPDALFWIYQIDNDKHSITYNWLNPNNDATVKIESLLVYGDTE